MIFRKLALDTVIYGGADFFTKIIAFLTFPIIAAALSPRAFGALDLIVTLVGLTGLLMNCGLNNAVQRFYWDKTIVVDSRAMLVSTGFYIQLALGGLLALAGAAAIPFVMPVVEARDLPLTVVALGAAVLLLLVTQATQYILDVMRLNFAPLKFLVFSLLGRVLTALLGVYVVVSLKGGIDGLLLVQACVGLAVIPLGLYLIRKDLLLGFDAKWARDLVSYGYPFIFAGLAYWLFGSIDRWMLASMSSVAEAGIYAVSFRFATIVLFVSMAFGQAWSPYSIKLRTDYPDTYRKLYADIFLVLLFVMMIVGGGISLFAGEIIAFLMPDAYQGSARPLAILSFAIILQATMHMTSVGISIERKTHLFARLAWAAAVLNVAGNYILIPLYGAVGAAWATLGCYLFLTAGYFYFSQKLHPVPLSWRRIGILGLLGCCVLLVSLVWNVAEIDWGLVAMKFVFAMICLGLGAFVLPLKELFHAR